MENSRLPLQVVAGGPLAGPSTPFSVPTLPHAQSITTHQGDFNQAGRDVIIQKHYHSYPDRVDISAVLGAVRNLRIIHLDILSKATPGTGVWLLKTDKFIIWLDPNGDLKILWGTGIPGAGKTVLVAIIIRELEALAEVEGSRICVCYVYIRYSDRADLSVRNILEIIVKQTVERHPDCELIAEKAYARHIREKTQPTESELLELLRQFTEVNAATFYFLDALDEAPDRIQVDLVLKLASLNARLFVTSRPLECVQARVPDAHCFPIIAQEGDLDLHINQEIARSRDLANFLENTDPSLRDEIISLVKSKCSGMFLHASLQLDALCECATAYEVRQTLEKFPSSIQDVYLQTWNRVLEQKSSHVLLAKTALLWVLNSSRPMSIEELERAVAISPETYKLEPTRLAPGTTLIAFCRGLVTLEEESKLVRLVHYTAKGTLQELLQDSFPHPHSHLATVCMTHLTQCGFQNTTISSEGAFIAARRADPLLHYASDAWAVHARASLDMEDARRRIANFVSECHAFPAFTAPDLSECFDILSPLHMPAMFHLPMSLITHSNIGDLNVATQIYEESPLILASWCGNEGAIASLLAHSRILVNLVSGDGRSALMVAACCGHEGIVKLLLAHPEIQINLVDVKGQSALMLAAKNGRESVVKLLLAHPEIQINLVNRNKRSALMLAAKNGHESVIKLLLARHEIQINLVDVNEQSALMLAANSGHESVVKLLLAHPEIQINLVDVNEQSALMLAANSGHESIVKLLLAHPEIQINLVDHNNWSSLMLAARNGYKSIVTLLLGIREIPINLVSMRGWSALMVAAENGCESVVELLLAHHEIQINLVDIYNQSTLMLAAENGCESIVKLLLVHPEIQINLVERNNRSSLMLAAKNGHESTVKLLLAHDEIQIDLVDFLGRSALMLAAENGHESIVKLLLPHHEVQINLVDFLGRSALMLAAKNGHESVIKLLLARHEIQINLVNCNKESALMLAAENGRESVVKLLLQRTDIQVNLVNYRGYSALVLAAEEGHESIVPLLLDVPYINTSTMGRDGNTAMSIALAKRHTGIVQLLQEFQSCCE